MKTFIFAAALVFGTAAIAQDTTAQPSGETVDDPSQSTGPEGITQQGTDPNGAAMAPPGTNQAPMAPGMMTPPPMANAPGMMSNMPAPMAAPASYPACSRTVTDRCTQTYERGRTRRR